MFYYFVAFLGQKFLELESQILFLLNFANSASFIAYELSEVKSLFDLRVELPLPLPESPFEGAKLALGALLYLFPFLDRKFNLIMILQKFDILFIEVGVGPPFVPERVNFHVIDIILVKLLQGETNIKFPLLIFPSALVVWFVRGISVFFSLILFAFFSQIGGNNFQLIVHA